MAASGVGPGSRNLSAWKPCRRRVCIVNSAGAVLLDRMVAQVERVTDFRTRFSGIRPRDLANAALLSQVRLRQCAAQCHGALLTGKCSVSEHGLPAIMRDRTSAASLPSI